MGNSLKKKKKSGSTALNIILSVVGNLFKLLGRIQELKNVS